MNPDPFLAGEVRVSPLNTRMLANQATRYHAPSEPCEFGLTENSDGNGPSEGQGTERPFKSHHPLLEEVEEVKLRLAFLARTYGITLDVTDHS
jgi:hypothetical protein